MYTCMYMMQNNLMISNLGKPGAKMVKIFLLTLLHFCVHIVVDTCSSNSYEKSKALFP